MITGGLPSPAQIERSPNSAKLGTVRRGLVTPRISVENRSDRAAETPKISPVRAAAALDLRPISMGGTTPRPPVVNDLVDDAHAPPSPPPAAGHDRVNPPARRAFRLGQLYPITGRPGELTGLAESATFGRLSEFDWSLTH